ncbi:hypothetical protein [Streptomyces sp. TRM49041]|uniref:hypothetical protein n=1 Tax=Streptomyces sp. TRM49041 TaxID=2603216 RepID=UPI0011EF3068|nr:hypothetical protein [Streptomyces sp. TRM49041]
MLALRLARGAHPLLQLRRLLVTTASAGVGFLLLCALGHAVAHPGQSSASLLRLGWCVLPLAAAVHLAVAVARTDPSTRPRPGLSSVGLGPARLTLIAATSTALACALGSALALLVYLHLRGDLTGLPFDGAAAGLLGAGQPLPLPGALTLLAVTPVTASTLAGITLRPRRPRADPDAGAPGQDGDAESVARDPFAPTPAPTGLPWGVTLIAVGLAVEVYGARGADGSAAPLPGGFPGSPVPVLAGWTLTALGLAVAGPGLAHLCGRLIQAYRPGATRLLSGRALMDESHRIGRPLGVLCAVVSAAIAAGALYGQTISRPLGPLTGLGAGLVLACATAALLTAAIDTRQSRAGTTAALIRLGAPAGLLRTAALLRTAVLLAVFTPLTWAVATLAALPLRA